MTLGQAQQLKVGDKLELAGKTWTVEALTCGGCILKDSEGAACCLFHLEIAALGFNLVPDAPPPAEKLARAREQLSEAISAVTSRREGLAELIAAGQSVLDLSRNVLKQQEEIDITGGHDATDYIEQQRGGDAETIDHYRRAGNWLSHQWAQDVGHAVPGLEDAWKATEEQP